MKVKSQLTELPGGPGTQTIHRAVQLLKLVTANQRTGFRLVDLYRRTGLERATVHRLLQGIVAEGLMRQDPQTKRYFLGSLIYEMGLAAAPKLALRDICNNYLPLIAEKSGGTVFLTVRSGFDGVCVARVDGNLPLKAFVLDVGRHRPLNVGAGGIAIMSALADDEIDRICRVNLERTLKNNPLYREASLRTAIAQARKLGYSTNKVMKSPSISSAGVLIRYSDGSPAGALSVSTLSSLMSRERMPGIVAILQDSVSLIERELSSRSSMAADRR